MSVLVFAESFEGEFKKQSFEAVSYARQVADMLATDLVTLILSGNNESELAKYGASKILKATGDFNQFDSGIFAQVIAQAAEQAASKVVIISNTPHGRALAPRVAVKLEAGIVSGANELPTTENGLTVKKSVFSGKGFANYSFESDKKVIAIQPNSLGVKEFEGSATVEEFTPDISGIRRVEVKGVNKESEGIPLPEAELVVSGGRGLKGPENWGMIEELAQLVGAATACSRPVADSDWRPHHEHVGQTGVAIRPNLYIAIAISGAIQHLAGVNQSKVIVVINKDPEAPFFKEADYGIVGDAFEVVPKLIESWKAEHA